MELICQSFYFYPNQTYVSRGKWNQEFHRYECDIEPYSQAIRIFGTEKQIDKALDEYCKKSGLNLDECYDFEDEETLKRYRKQYKNKGLIINIK
tara:strand:- start:319 stop:600 length:282 start_codon:yes stop_codon:yes gene_type:complete